MSTSKTNFVFLLILLIPLLGVSQTVKKESFELFINGNTSSHMVMKDSIAYLGTNFGIARINLIEKKHEFIYSPEVDHFMLGDNILFTSKASVDNDGNLWFVRDNEIYHYDAKTKNLIHIDAQPKYKINTIASDPLKNLWIGFDTGQDVETEEAIGLLEGNQIEYLSIGTLGVSVKEIRFGNASSTFFNTDNGIYRLDQQGITLIPDSEFTFSTLIVGSDNQLASSGKIFGSILKYYTGDEWLRSSQAIYKYGTFDQNGLLWVMTETGYLHHYDEINNNSIQISNSPIHNYTGDNLDVNSMGFDSNETLWLSIDEGLFYWDEVLENWTQYRFVNSDFSTDNMQDIECADDSIWILNHEKSLLKIVDFNFSNLNKIDLPTGVSKIMFDNSRNGLWAASSNNKYIYLITDNIQQFEIEPLVNNAEGLKIIELSIDVNNNVFLLTTRGILRYSNDKWEMYLGISALDDRRILINTNSEKGDIIWFYESEFVVDKIVLDEPRLLQITDEGVMRIDHINIPKDASSLSVLNDTTFVFVGDGKLTIQNRDIYEVFESFTIGPHDVHTLNDSTLLVCAQSGMYIINSDGTAFKPYFDDPWISNNKAFPASLNPNGEIVMQHHQILKIKDFDKLISLEDPNLEEGEEEEINNNENEIIISPNPAFDFLTVKVDLRVSETDKLKVLIFNLQGMKYLEKTITKNDMVNINSIPEGSYVILILKNDELIHSEKLIKL